MKKSTPTARARTKSMKVYTLWDALTEAVLTFPPNDAVGSLGDAYCPISEIATWMATMPVAQSTARRYVIRMGDITNLVTGQVAAHFMTMEMLPAHVPVRQDGTARVREDELNFLFAVESLRFVTSTGAWDRTGRFRPVVLDEDGIEFEDV